MSDDIVKRLRDEIDVDVNEPLDRLLEEAADRIERLSASNAELAEALRLTRGVLRDEIDHMTQSLDAASDAAIGQRGRADAMSDDTKPDSDLAEILALFINYIMNERAYNEGFDAGQRAAADEIKRLRAGGPAHFSEG